MENERSPLRKRFPVKLLAVLLLAGLAMGQGEPDKARPKITKLGILLSRETTYILGPVNEDGTVDYVDYFRQGLSKGVMPQDNAAVLITKAIGPSEYCTPDEIRELEEVLQIKLSEEDEYFQVYEGGYEELNSAYTEPWDAREYPAIYRWLEQNKRPLELLREAACKSSIYYPQRFSFYDQDGSTHLVYALIPFQGRIRQAGRALAIRSMLRLAQGEDKKASEDILALYRLARHVEATDLSAYSGLISLGMEAIAIRTDISFIRACRGKSNLLQEHLDGVGKIRPKRNLLERYEQWERMSLLDMFQFLAATPPGRWETILKRPGSPLPHKEFQWLTKVEPMPVEWNDALRKANRIYDMHAELLRCNLNGDAAAQLTSQLQAEKDRMAEETTPKRIAQRLKDMKGLAPGQQATGTADLISDAILLKWMVWNFEKAIEVQRRVALKRITCQTSLALQIYQARRGAYPEKLADLAPGILPRIPVDPFAKDDQTLRYTSDGKTAVVYSVGADGKDNGGTDLRFTAEADEDADAGYRLGPGTRVHDEE